MWADTEFDEPLNYEKRAPFPTINLLRAAKIREFTSEVRADLGPWILKISHTTQYQ
jgi:hypothetical protein